MYSLVVKAGVWVAVTQQVLCKGCLSSPYVSVLATSARSLSLASVSRVLEEDWDFKSTFMCHFMEHNMLL